MSNVNISVPVSNARHKATGHALVMPHSILSHMHTSTFDYICYLERVLGAHLVVHGNFVYLEPDTPRLRTQLQSIIDNIAQYILSGQTINTHIIDAFISDAQDGANTRAQLLTRAVIELKNATQNIHARTVNQAHYINAMRANEIVLVTGPAGSGKTYLAVAHAVSALLNGAIAKIVIVRPVVEAGEHLGFLPGDIEQKLHPYIRPIYDVLECILTPKEIASLYQRKAIELIPLAYMRGRSLKNSCILLDEAQNTTEAQMLMLLTRVGLKSQLIVSGDITQIDLPSNIESGLIRAIKMLDNIQKIAIINLGSEDIVRSALVCTIIKAFGSVVR